MKYLQNILIAIDQLINAVLLGDPDETISSRVGRVWPNSYLSIFVDFIMFYQKNHCCKAIEKSEGYRDILFPRKNNM
jgi:hypothetical protein